MLPVLTMEPILDIKAEKNCSMHVHRVRGPRG